MESISAKLLINIVEIIKHHHRILSKLLNNMKPGNLQTHLKRNSVT